MRRVEGAGAVSFYTNAQRKQRRATERAVCATVLCFMFALIGFMCFCAASMIAHPRARKQLVLLFSSLTGKPVYGDTVYPRKYEEPWEELTPAHGAPPRRLRGAFR